VSSPTALELENQLRAIVKILEDYDAGVSTTLVANHDALIQILESDFSRQISSGASALRSRASGVMSSSVASGMLAPWLTAYAHHIVGVPERSSGRALDRIFDFFVANSKTIKERNFTYDAGEPFSFTGTGTGELYRLVIGEHGGNIENIFTETKTLRCIRDGITGGIPHEEVFEFRGTNAGPDLVDVQGSGIVRRNFSAVSSNQSLLTNPSFSQFSIAGSVAVGAPYTLVAGDTITGWTIPDVTDVQLDRDEFYRDVQGDTNPTSLRLLDNTSLTQTLATEGVRLNPDIPYLTCLAIKRESSADGTLTIGLGSNTKAITVSSLSNGVWTPILLDRDTNLWPANFNATDIAQSLTYAGRTTGTVILDEVVLRNLVQIDGTWWWLTGGETKFLLDDTLSVTDTLPADSKIQKWLWRTFGRYLPAAAVPTIADPA
jgi:hypothetical protein